MTIAVIDADVIIYQACAYKAAAPAVDFGEEDMATAGGTLDETVRLAEDKLSVWMRIANASECVLAFSGPTDANFRRAVNPDYKSERSPDKPEHYAEVAEFLTAKYSSVAQHTLEGDDLLGLLLTERVVDVAISTDKDIYTLPGRLLRIASGGTKQEPSFINTVVGANRYWMQQTLSGDAVDGYHGCPGIGVIGAAKVLKDTRFLQEMWSRVVETYDKQFAKPKVREKYKLDDGPGPFELALRNARCARILRDGDYNNLTGEVKLWTP